MSGPAAVGLWDGHPAPLQNAAAVSTAPRLPGGIRIRLGLSSDDKFFVKTRLGELYFLRLLIPFFSNSKC